LITGENVYLRALERTDFQKILDWINNPELKYLTGTLYPITDAEHEKWFQMKLVEKTNKSFGIVDRLSDEIIGVIGFNNTDFINRNAEIYIYIGDKSYWGKGLGTDSVKTLVNFAFGELNLHRISLVVFSYNTRAIRSYEKAGFVTEGILKESIFKAGKYHDKVLMAILNNN
jgi:UDP-4-amino-4,6-dideoxy-N-acetyl-beta-L-altrosamine N-acetyltransferase